MFDFKNFNSLLGRYTLKKKFFGHLVIASLSMMALTFSCGSDSKKSSSQNTNEEEAALNGLAKPTLAEATQVENSTLIIRYKHVLDNVTFQCKIKFNGAEAQWSFDGVSGFRLDAGERTAGHTLRHRRRPR